MAGGSSKQDRAQQKALEKQKQKIVEDKTFGLKNKKGKSVQKYIKSLQQQITGKPAPTSEKYIAQQNKEKQEKQKALQQQALLASLFKSTEKVKEASMESQKELYDPKKDREDQKIDLYTDQRLQRCRDDDKFANLDLDALEHAVHEQFGNTAFSTEIVCKHFINAVENKTYGWFWVCPNGGDKCKYRHCLPPDYVLKSDVPQEVVDEEETLEERIERQRAELPPGGEMVTAESLARWREAREQGRIETLKETMAKDKNAQLTGKDLFTFNPSLFLDDEGAAADLDYDEEIDIDEIISQNENALKTGNVMPDELVANNVGETNDETNSIEMERLKI